MKKLLFAYVGKLKKDKPICSLMQDEKLKDEFLSQDFQKQLEYYKLKNAINTTLRLKEFVKTHIFNETGMLPNDKETTDIAVEMFLNLRNSPFLDSLNNPVSKIGK